MKINKLNGLDVVFENHSDDHVRAVVLYGDGDVLYVDEACDIPVSAEVLVELCMKQLVVVRIDVSGGSFSLSPVVQCFVLPDNRVQVYVNHLDEQREFTISYPSTEE